MYPSEGHEWSVHTPILAFMAGFTFILKDCTAPSWRIHFMKLGLMLILWFGLIFSIRIWALYTKRFIILRKMTSVVLVYNVRVDLMCMTIGSVMIYYAAMNGTNIDPIYLAIGYAATFTCIYWFVLARQLHLLVTMIERFDLPLD